MLHFTRAALRQSILNLVKGPAAKRPELVDLVGRIVDLRTPTLMLREQDLMDD